MNTKNISAPVAFALALGLLLWTNTGCQHGPPKNTTPVAEIQAPLLRTVTRPDEDPAEKRLQDKINAMQEQIATLAAQTETLARVHGSQMGPKWVEKVKAARAESSRPSERMRYLEATETLLTRKLQALRAEIKVFESFQQSDPTITRP